jgi:hypothetical protein
LNNRLSFTQNTDEFFPTTSNQIVKDLRSQNPPSTKRRNQLQASKLVLPRRVPPKGSQHGQKTQNLKRAKQEGRIPLRTVARPKFCYHSLRRIFIIYTTCRLLTQARTAKDPPNSVTQSEYQSPANSASPAAKTRQIFALCYDCLCFVVFKGVARLQPSAFS